MLRQVSRKIQYLTGERSPCCNQWVLWVQSGFGEAPEQILRVIKPLVRFGYAVDDLEVDAERFSGLAQCAARAIGRHCGSYRGTVATILFINVLDNLFAALVLEVDVNVRWLAALFADESLEEHVTARGVHFGHPEAVADSRVRGRTSALAKNVFATGEPNNVVHREEVGFVFQLTNKLQLVLYLLLHRARNPSRETPMGSDISLLPKKLGNRKWLAVAGYGLGALSKPLFAVAPTIGIVVTARIMDRVGKGIRGAPRDALVADVTRPHLRGAAFGLRQSLDTIGAFLGPLLAVVIMLVGENNFRLAFGLAVALLTFGIEEPAREPGAKRVNPIRWDSVKQLGTSYWWVVVVGGVFALARFSEAFLVLRTMGSGVPIALVPLVMVAMNVVYALSAYPFGKLADTMSHTRLLVAGLVILIASDVVLAHGTHWGIVLVGVALWGLHMGMTQGLLATMVAQTAPAQLRGTAFGFFSLLSGIVTLVSSVIAGALWDRLGAAATFYAGAAFCALTIAMLLFGRTPDTTAGR
jgi:MFS family permease